jgi:hypothetical protein
MSDTKRVTQEVRGWRRFAPGMYERDRFQIIRALDGDWCVNTKRDMGVYPALIIRGTLHSAIASADNAFFAHTPPDAGDVMRWMSRYGSRRGRSPQARS